MQTNSHSDSTVMLARFLFPITILSILVGAHFNTLIHQMSAGLAVISGILLSLLFSNPYANQTKKLASTLLTWSVIGLGFGMNLITVAKVGLHGIGYTVIGISLCAILGIIMGKCLNNSRDTSVLITFGTAICGGSAIAAIAPTIKAQHHEISVALAIVFTLNAISLFIFPGIGHYLQLSQEQFGLWSALAIHDTSSVVGASLQYGAKALEVGTTVKLARALWIVPVTFMIALAYSRFVFHTGHANGPNKIKKPWFILGFLLAAALVTWVPSLKLPGLYIRDIAEQTLVITLFCIGANLSRDMIKTVGFKPFIQGILLWLAMASLTLAAIYYHYVSL
jgi:uncharacterized integral membrane protein (TIGR00698 family)